MLASPGGHLAFTDFVGVRIRGAYLCFHRRAQARFIQLGVTADQFVLMAILAEREGLTQRELTQLSYSDANTVTGMLNRLERRGLVERRLCKDDARLRRIHLTAQGRCLEKKLQALATPFHKSMDNTLPPDCRLEVMEWLDRVIAEMGSGNAPKPPVAAKTRREK